MAEPEFQYLDRAMHISKGPDYSVRFRVPTPFGEYTVQVPLSEVYRVISTLNQYAAEQSEAMSAELAKWINGG